MTSGDIANVAPESLGAGTPPLAPAMDTTVASGEAADGDQARKRRRRQMLLLLSALAAMAKARRVAEAHDQRALGLSKGAPAPGLQLLPTEHDPRVRRWQRVEPHEVQPGARFIARDPDQHDDHVLHVRHVHGAEAGLSWGTTRSVWHAPVASVPQLVDDLRREVNGTPTSADPALNVVLRGDGEWLGKGNEGIVHRVGPEIVKSATVAGYHPENGIRTVEEANQITRNEHATHEALARHPLVPRTRLVEHEGRAHLVKPFLHPAGRLSRAEAEQAQDLMETAHSKGLALLDQWQFGRDDGGALKVMDLGSARRSTADGHREDDHGYMDRLWREHGHEGREPQGVELDRKLAGARVMLNFALQGKTPSPRLADYWARYKRLHTAKTTELLVAGRDDDWDAAHDERDALAARIEAIQAGPSTTAARAAAG